MSESPPSCSNPKKPLDESQLQILHLHPKPPLKDYQAALQLANQAAEAALGAVMLLSWYDRDRDFEAPQHASECHANGALPGYVDYGIHHGARLKIDIEDGRFVFFYLPLENLEVL